MRNIILTVYCWFANRNAATPKFVVFTVCDETLGAAEYGEYSTYKAAMNELLEQERICDPDSYWWIEESGTNNVYDSDSHFDAQLTAELNAADKADWRAMNGIC